MKKPRRTRRASVQPQAQENYQTANIFLTSLSPKDQNARSAIQAEVDELLAGKTASRSRQNLNNTQNPRSTGIKQMGSLCTLIDTCHGLHKEHLIARDQPTSSYNQNIAELMEIRDRMDKMGQAVGKYIDMEKVQQENIRNEQAARRVRLQTI